PNKPRAGAIPPQLITTDLNAVLNDPEVHAVAELVGGTDWALPAVLAALAAGKHVVTANKALLAQHGPEVFDAARRHGCTVAFGATVPVGRIERRGIADVDAMDIRFAKELGYTIKLLAEAWQGGRQLALHVEPVLLRHAAPLAQVRGAYNAVQVVGDAVGDTLYYGPGAGALPTASAVTADLIDLAVGRAQRTFQTLRLWADAAGGV